MEKDSSFTFGAQEVHARLTDMFARLFLIVVLIYSQAVTCAFADTRDIVAELIFLDVGEGDAALVLSQGQTLLVDTGNLITGAQVHKELIKRKISNIDKIVLTHPHADHIGGIFSVLPRVSFNNIYDNGQSLADTKEDIYRWYADLVRSQSSYKSLSAKEEFFVGEVKGEVVWPDPSMMTEDWNTNSLVLRLHMGPLRVLLMGDANKATEAILLKEKVDLQATILKVGHHGAADASSKAFLDCVKPKVSIVSVNKDNIRGYPSADTMQRLSDSSKALVTKDAGTITVKAFPDGTYDILTEK